MSVAALTACTEKTAAATRLLGLDMARLVASLAIIWIHAPRSAVLAGTTVCARFAVPFFTYTAVYFAFRKGDRDSRGKLAAVRKVSPLPPGEGQGVRAWLRNLSEPHTSSSNCPHPNPLPEGEGTICRGFSDSLFLQYGGSRLARLYLPFLAWSAVYLAFKAVKRVAAPDQPNDFGGWEMLWTGSAYHLWFLPFILVASVAAYAVAAATAAHARARIGIAAMAAVFGVAAAIAPPLGIMDASEANRYIWFALPCVGWGIALAAFYPHFRHDAPGVTSTGLFLCAVAMLSLAATGRQSLLENLAGLGFAFAAFNWSPDVRIGRFASLGGLAYGVYCSHLLFIKICESVFSKFHCAVSPQLDLATFIIAIVCSAGLAWLLAASRWTRWLVA